VREIGTVLGEECQDKHIDMLLAPGVNVHRAPRNGRHFEYYSEDPVLSARMAVSYIQGVQSTGVGACVKHFVANDQETNRMTVDVQVDERTLREIYLPAFEAAVKEARVRAVMGAYNFVNGHHACAHPELLQDLLKEEWGFAGLVVSDWAATKETVGPALHGLDLEMPAGGHWDRGQLQAAVERGDVPEALIDEKVRRILTFLAWRERLQGQNDETETPVEHPAHRELARRAATETMVLLRNEGQLLPLQPGKKIAIIGPLAQETSLLGGGSASLQMYRKTSVLAALTERLDPKQVIFAPGVLLRRSADTLPAAWLSKAGVLAELFAGSSCDGEPFATEHLSEATSKWFGENWPQGIEQLSVRERMTMTPPQSGRHRFMASGLGHVRLWVNGELVADNMIEQFSPVFALNASTGECDLEAGQPYEILVEHTPIMPYPIVLINVGCELLPDNEALLQEAAQVAAEADIAIVVVGSSDEWESEGNDRDSCNLPAGQDQLVQGVLAANPNTVVVLNCGAPMALPWFEAVPATLLAWYPGQEGGEAIADVLLGVADPGGRMPTTWARREQDTPAYLTFPGEANTTLYGEGIYVGYRWYDAREISPLLPFGSGSSYATFTWGEPAISGFGTDLLVEVPITNVSPRSGSEVVQVYVSSACSPVHRPRKELVGFAKVHLVPGETGIASIKLTSRSFARWDLATHAWKVDAGAYTLLIAASATDVRIQVPHLISG
jgi:beta-glucosidase